MPRPSAKQQILYKTVSTTNTAPPGSPLPPSANSCLSYCCLTYLPSASQPLVLGRNWRNKSNILARTASATPGYARLGSPLLPTSSSARLKTSLGPYEPPQSVGTCKAAAECQTVVGAAVVVGATVVVVVVVASVVVVVVAPDGPRISPWSRFLGCC